MTEVCGPTLTATVPPLAWRSTIRKAETETIAPLSICFTARGLPNARIVTAFPAAVWATAAEKPGWIAVQLDGAPFRSTCVRGAIAKLRVLPSRPRSTICVDEID